MSSRWTQPLLLLCALLAVVACSPTPSAPTPSPSASVPAPTSGIDGLVLAGPTCPVERAGESPCVRPLPGATIVIAGSSGEEVARLTTDAQGHFRVALPAGVYTVRPQPVQGLMGVGREQSVTVPAESFVDVVVSYDTGIR